MTLSRHFYPVLGILTILTAASFSTTRGRVVPPSTSNVTVTNSAAQPIPTAAQGTTQVAGTVGLSNGTNVGISGTPAVTISGTPSVAISGTPSFALSGTPSVTVSGTPTVALVNDANNPLPVRDTDVHFPIRGQGIADMPDNFASEAPSLSFQDDLGATGTVVPVGRRLVVESFFIRVTLPAGQGVQLGMLNGFPIPMISQGLDSSGQEVYVGAISGLDLSINSGVQMYGEVIRNNSSSEGFMACGFTGYLVKA